MGHNETLFAKSALAGGGGGIGTRAIGAWPPSGRPLPLAPRPTTERPCRLGGYTSYTIARRTPTRTADGDTGRIQGPDRGRAGHGPHGAAAPQRAREHAEDRHRRGRHGVARPVRRLWPEPRQGRGVRARLRARLRGARCGRVDRPRRRGGQLPRELAALRPAEQRHRPGQALLHRQAARHGRRRGRVAARRRPRRRRPARHRPEHALPGRAREAQGDDRAGRPGPDIPRAGRLRRTSSARRPPTGPRGSTAKRSPAAASSTT